MVGGEGLRVPPSAGENGAIVAVQDNSVQRAIPAGIETGSFALRAWDNNETIYIGYDETVDDATGFPMEDGEVISVDLNAAVQGVFFFAEQAGDGIRYITTE